MLIPDRENVIKAWEQVLSQDPLDVPWDLIDDTLALLKAQEPRLVVKEDFVNADRWGYLPVYVEDRDGQMYWDCITDVVLGGTVSRFWTAKPTDEQREAVKWDDA